MEVLHHLQQLTSTLCFMWAEVSAARQQEKVEGKCGIMLRIYLRFAKWRILSRCRAKINSLRPVYLWCATMTNIIGQLINLLINVTASGVKSWLYILKIVSVTQETLCQHHIYTVLIAIIPRSPHSPCTQKIPWCSNDKWENEETDYRVFSFSFSFFCCLSVNEASAKTKCETYILPTTTSKHWSDASLSKKKTHCDPCWLEKHFRE